VLWVCVQLDAHTNIHSNILNEVLASSNGDDNTTKQRRRGENGDSYPYIESISFGIEEKKKG
jgi:hypothetical protein